MGCTGRWWEVGSQCLTETELRFGKMEEFWRWRLVTLHEVSPLNAAELCTQNG